MYELLDRHTGFEIPPNFDLNLNQVFVIIPVLNEEASIGGVIKNLQHQGLQHICIVDNGSSDRSGEIATAQGAKVVKEPKPGYGQACWRGLQDLPPHIEWILFCDGDGSDDLSQLPRFFQAANKADFILANRRGDALSRSRLTLAQNFGNALAVTLIHWGWGYQYNDLGPLRLIHRSALERISMADRAFGWTVEMQVRAVEEKLRIIEIPSPYRDRQGGESKISGTLQGVFRAGVGILGTIGKFYGQKLQRQPYQIARNFTNLLFTRDIFSWAYSQVSHLLLITYYSLLSFCKKPIISAILLLLGCLIMEPHGGFDSTPSFLLFCLGAIIMALGFACSGLLPRLSAPWFWGVSILTRALLLPMKSGDDVWRYLWEGYLQTQGFSPYGLPPNAVELIPYRTEWWELMNYHEISAIYPPLTQLGFRLLAQIALSVIVFKLGFVIADLAICALLSRRYGYQQASFYAWNPLVIYSFAGGAHYDSWFILPLVAAWFLFEERRWLMSAFCLGISIGIKWISLPLLAFLLWRMRWQRAIIILAVASLPLLLTTPVFCQLGSCSLIPVESSFVVKARSADFIPYILSQFWSASRQTNWIFALPLAAAILGLLWFCKRFSPFAQAYFFVLLSLSPVVHGWYFTWIMPFGVATRNWGIRLLSFSAFIYFLLPYRQFAGLEVERWHLTALERGILWLPFIIGFLCSFSFQAQKKLSLDFDTSRVIINE